MEALKVVYSSKILFLFLIFLIEVKTVDNYETVNYTFNSFCSGSTDLKNKYQHCCITIDDSTCCLKKDESLFDLIMPSCCQEYAYDTVSSLCCDNSILPIIGQNDDPKCCGSKVFDNTVSICCQNNILNRRNLKNAQCCGKNAYDPFVSDCVDDKQIVFL